MSTRVLSAVNAASIVLALIGAGLVGAAIDDRLEDGKRAAACTRVEGRTYGQITYNGNNSDLIDICLGGTP